MPVPGHTPPGPVALRDCRSYAQSDVDRALASACADAGFPDPTGATVLLKPNLLRAAAPELAVTTHPAVVRAAVRYLRSRGAARVLVGDSPGWQPEALAGAKSGVMAAAREEGAEWADFSESVALENPGGLLVRRFSVARPVAEADMVVSLPKLKTHSLMYFTGAAKNLFGVVPGIQKSAFHMRFPDRADFAAMICDLVMALKPAFSVMDAVVGMEGPGPNNGRPVDIGLILASRDAFALDWIASGLVGYRPGDIPYLALAAADPRYGFCGEDVSTVGEDPARRAPARFERVHILKESDIFRRYLPSWAYALFKNAMVQRPFFSERACVRCAACVKICPADALAFAEGRIAPRVDYAKCIRCYCCHEVCPADAIALKRRMV